MRTDKEKAASMLGLARKAGKIADGALAAEKAVKSGKAALVILAEDASANTRKKFSDMAAWREIPVGTFLTMDALGQKIGRDDRSVLAVTDQGFAEAIQKLLNDIQ